MVMRDYDSYALRLLVESLPLLFLISEHSRGRRLRFSRRKMESSASSLSYMHGAHGIQDSYDGYAYVGEHGQPHAGDAPCSKYQYQELYA